MKGVDLSLAQWRSMRWLFVLIFAASAYNQRFRILYSPLLTA